MIIIHVHEKHNKVYVGETGSAHTAHQVWVCEVRKDLHIFMNFVLQRVHVSSL